MATSRLSVGDLWQNRRRLIRPEVPAGSGVPSALPWPAASASAAARAAANSAVSVTSCCVASRYVSCREEEQLLLVQCSDLDHCAGGMPVLCHATSDPSNDSCSLDQ